MHEQDAAESVITLLPSKFDLEHIGYVCKILFAFSSFFRITTETTQLQIKNAQAARYINVHGRWQGPLSISISCLYIFLALILGVFERFRLHFILIGGLKELFIIFFGIAGAFWSNHGTNPGGLLVVSRYYVHQIGLAMVQHLLALETPLFNCTLFVRIVLICVSSTTILMLAGRYAQVWYRRDHFCY